MLEPSRKSGGRALEADTPHDLNSALLKIASLEWQETATAEELLLEGLEEDWGAYTGLPPRVELLDDGRGAHLLAALSTVVPTAATGRCRRARGSTAPRFRGRCGA